MLGMSSHCSRAGAFVEVFACLLCVEGEAADGALEDGCGLHLWLRRSRADAIVDNVRRDSRKVTNGLPRSRMGMLLRSKARR